MPGIGKTHWAIQRICKMSAKRAGILMYVAPTIKLLEEVYEQIKGHVAAETKLYFLHGGSMPVSRQINAALLGGAVRKNANFWVERAEAGDVLFITHAAFINMAAFPRADEIFVFFDEAKKLVVQIGTPEFPLSDTLDFYGKVLDIRKEGSFSKVSSIVPVETAKQILSDKRIIRDSNGRKNTYGVAFLRFFRKVINPRLEIYVAPIKGKYQFFEAILPSRVFSGFKRSYLMAANFTDSQMYHMLRDKVNFINLTPKLPTERKKLLLSQYKNTIIVPLTKTERPLSKWSLSGLLAREGHEIRIANEIFATGARNTIRELATIAFAHLPVKTSKECAKAVQILRREKASNNIHTKPFLWYYEEFLKVHKRMTRKYGLEGPPILAVNKQYAEYVDTRSILLPFMPQGLNSYMGSNCVGYIAAVNPTPAMIRFFKFYLPTYDFALDHVGDHALQCVTRSAIRDVNNEKPVVVVVTDLAIARILQNKLFGLPKIINYRAEFVHLHYFRNVRLLTANEKAEKNRARVKKWWQNEENRLIHSLNVRIYRLRKHPQTPEIREKIAELQNKIHAIKVQKTLSKPINKN